MIPHSRPSLGEAEAEAAARVVRSGQLAQGPEVLALENELAAQIGVRHAVAVSSGTAALHLGLLALGVKTDDTVAIPSYVCTALLQAVRHAGAQPLLLDADRHNLGPNAEGLAGPNRDEIRAVVLPHLFGRAGDLPGFLESGIPMIEDCAMSLGSTYDARALGSFGAIGVYSFYATKMICSGEGGALTTDDEGIADVLRDLRDYDGRDNDAVRYNYKLTDLQAAVARVQLRNLDQFAHRRRHLARRYSDALKEIDAELPRFQPGEIPFRFVILHPDGADALIPRFEDAGIAVRKPVHLPQHRLLGLPAEEYGEAERLFRSAVSLPLYPGLTDEEADTVIRVAGDIL